MKVEEIVRKEALINALCYNGKADVKAVASRVFGKYPELRKSAREVMEVIREVVEEINAMEMKEIEELCSRLGIEKEEKRKKKDRYELEEIEVTNELPVFRIAPNPNGPLHIGHARVCVLNHEYCKKYNGILILRFDDTDAKNKYKAPLREAYDMIREDLLWLGIEWQREILASMRLNLYYFFFKKCIENGIAYVCTCNQEEWRERVRKKREACECRSKSKKENLEDFEKMLRHEYKEGEAVGRIKTEIEKIDNPAVIDWVALRIVDNPIHPLKKAHLWPTLDFASAIDDKVEGVTHIIRGKDLATSEERQRIIYDAFSWEYPKVYTYGKVFSDKYILSTSKMREMIERGEIESFSDLRLVTLRALRRRGITPEAVRRYMLRLGLNQNETKFDEEILFSENRKVIDRVARRFFAVEDCVEIKLSGSFPREVTAKISPYSSEARKIRVSERILVERKDFERFKGREVRLMHFCNVILDEEAKVTGFEIRKDVPKIHWVPKDYSFVVKLLTPDKESSLIVEENVRSVAIDEVVQFERKGFYRRESEGTFVFCHR